MLKVEDLIKRLQSVHAVALDKTSLYINNMSIKELNNLINDTVTMLAMQAGLSLSAHALVM